MQINVDLEEDVLSALEGRAKERGASLDSVLSDLLRKELQGQREAEPVKERYTFRLSGGAVTSDDVRAVLDQDDE